MIQKMEDADQKLKSTYNKHDLVPGHEVKRKIKFEEGGFSTDCKFEL